MTIKPQGAALHATLDPATGIIHVDASIFWAPDDLDPILDRLAHFVSLVHAGHKRALVMVNFGAAGPQMGDTVERVKQKSAAIYAPGDRLAIVLQSSLLKLQISRVQRTAEHMTFASREEAEAWLLSPPTAEGKAG